MFVLFNNNKKYTNTHINRKFLYSLVSPLCLHKISLINYAEASIYPHTSNFTCIHHKNISLSSSLVQNQAPIQIQNAKDFFFSLSLSTRELFSFHIISCKLMICSHFIFLSLIQPCDMPYTSTPLVSLLLHHTPLLLCFFLLNSKSYVKCMNVLHL